MDGRDGSIRRRAVGTRGLVLYVMSVRCANEIELRAREFLGTVRLWLGGRGPVGLVETGLYG